VITSFSDFHLDSTLTLSIYSVSAALTNGATACIVVCFPKIYFQSSRNSISKLRSFEINVMDWRSWIRHGNFIEKGSKINLTSMINQMYFIVIEIVNSFALMNITESTDHIRSSSMWNCDEGWQQYISLHGWSNGQEWLYLWYKATGFRNDRVYYRGLSVKVVRRIVRS